MKGFKEVVFKELIKEFERACLGSKSITEVAEKMGCDLDVVKCLM